MRILIISKSLPFAFQGGIQSHVWNLSGALADRGNEVTILTAGNHLSKPVLNTPEGLEVAYLPYMPSRFVPGVGQSVEEYYFNKLVNRWVNNHIGSFDVIHVQGRSGCLLHDLDLSVPIVYTIHRLFSIEAKWSRSEYKNDMDFDLHYKINEKCEQKLIERADQLIAVSRQTAIETFERYGYDFADKLRVIYNGVRVPNGEVVNIEQKRRLIYVGRLVEIKGIFSLIDSMKYVNQGIDLVVIGDGPSKQEIEAKIHENGLEDRISLLGALNNYQVYKEIASSYALILPSFHESQGIVINEGNILGKPVIAANNSGIREMVVNGFNGLLFRAGDALQMASAINQMFMDENRACKMGENGRKNVYSKFLWKDIARQTEEVYQKAIVK